MIVDIPGVGQVQFPDDMSHDDITRAIQTNILKTPVKQPPSSNALQRGGEYVRENTGQNTAGDVAVDISGSADEPSLKQAASNIWQGLTNRQQWKDTGEAAVRTAKILPNVAESVGRGALASPVGAIGDINQLIVNHVGSLSDKNYLPTTEDILKFVPRVSSAYEGSGAHEMVGGLVNLPTGAIGKVAQATGVAEPIMRGVSRAGEIVTAPVQPAINAVRTGRTNAVNAVRDAGSQVRAGYDSAVHGYGTSAYQPVDPAVVKLAQDRGLITPREAQIVNNRKTLPVEGRGVQAWTENLISGYKNKPVQELAFDVLPSLATGAPIPGGAVKEGIKALRDVRVANKIRSTESPNIIRTAEGELLGAGSRAKNSPTGTATINTATGEVRPLSPKELAEQQAIAKRQQWQQENDRKIAELRAQRLAEEAQQTAEIEAQQQAERVAAEQLAKEQAIANNPKIQAVRQRAQRALPKESAVQPVEPGTLQGNQLSAEMRRQIEQRVQQQELQRRQSIDAALQQPAEDLTRSSPVAQPVLSAEEKLAELKRALQERGGAVSPESLFEGLPTTTITKAEQASMRRAEKEGAEMAAEREQSISDTSDLGKKVTQAQIDRKYQQLKNAKTPAARARLQRELDELQNSMSDQGLDVLGGGRPKDVLGMMTDYPDKKSFEEAKIMAELGNREFHGSYVDEAGNRITESKVRAQNALPAGLPDDVKKRIAENSPEWTRQVRHESTNPTQALKQRMEEYRRKNKGN